MKFSKPKGADITNTAIQVGGGVVGAALSDGLVGVVVKDPTKKTLIRVAVAGLGIVGASAVQGKSTTGELLKGAFVGMAIQQSVKVVKENVVKILPENDGKTINKFLHDAFGMGAGIPAPAMRYLAMGEPFSSEDFSLANPVMLPEGKIYISGDDFQ